MENEETEPSIQSADLRMLKHCLHFVHAFLGSANLNITIENHYHGTIDKMTINGK
jgi:hypothetical protein